MVDEKLRIIACLVIHKRGVRIVNGVQFLPLRALEVHFSCFFRHHDGERVRSVRLMRVARSRHLLMLESVFQHRFHGFFVSYHHFRFGCFSFSEHTQHVHGRDERSRPGCDVWCAVVAKGPAHKGKCFYPFDST